MIWYVPYTYIVSFIGSCERQDVVEKMKFITAWSALGLIVFFIKLPGANGGSLSGGSMRPSLVIGESALMDKETGRVFWEGGSSSTLSASVAPKLKAILGVHHLKASLLSGILLLAVVGFLAQWLKDKIDQSTLFQRRPRPFYLNASLFLIQWTILRAPKFEPWFLASIVILYLLEAFFCSTKRFLANAIEGDELEKYLEQLRDTPPVIEWKVRSFHYEPRAWTAPLAGLLEVWGQIRQKQKSTVASSLLEPSSQEVSQPSWVRRKKVTQVSTGSYNFTSCVDRTVVGVWKRANAVDSANSAPFIKLTLTKLLVLADAKTRHDYFQQQSQFVTDHCQEDRMAEFSTNIQVAGYKPKLLAVRHRRQATTIASRFFRLHFFWFFTLLGLSLPYRIWLSNHCDEMRVTITKETSSEEAVANRGWFSPKKTSTKDESKEAFRSLMENLMLYSVKREQQQQGEALKREEIIDVVQSAESAIAVAEEEKLEEQERSAIEKEKPDISSSEASHSIPTEESKKT